MSLANLHFYWLFSLVFCQLYIYKQNIEVTMDKEDYSDDKDNLRAKDYQLIAQTNFFIVPKF